MKTKEKILEEMNRMEERASRLCSYAYALESGETEFVADDELVATAPWGLFNPTKEDTIADCRKEAQELKNKVSALRWVLDGWNGEND